MLHHYHITVRPDGLWQGGKAHALVPFVLADTLHDVEEMMCEMALLMGRSQVLIHGIEGELLGERVFGPAEALR